MVTDLGILKNSSGCHGGDLFTGAVGSGSGLSAAQSAAATVHRQCASSAVGFAADSGRVFIITDLWSERADRSIFFTAV